MVAYVSPTRTSPLQGASAVSRHVREAAGVALSHFIGFANFIENFFEWLLLVDDGDVE
jgi:hypothetical protein